MSPGHIPDWRDPGAYQALRGCDASLHAWEWLRRDPAYRFAHQAADHDAARRFGLHSLEDPALGTRFARPLWLESIDPSVITVSASPSSDPGAFDIDRRRPPILAHLDRGHAEHLFLGDGVRSLRLDLASGTLRAGPVQLRCHLPALAHAMPVITALKRFSIWYRTGRLVASDHPSVARASRWVTLLRVHDALVDGASQREIAEIMFGERAAGHRWRVDAAPYRSRVQRLVRSARIIARTGASAFLRPPVNWRG